GAGRGRLVRQLLAESLLLSMIGGALGIVVAWWALQMVGTITPPPGAARLAAIHLDARLLGAMTLISIATGLVFGLTPALAASRVSLASSLNDSARGSLSGLTRYRLREALVTAQIALALVSLVGAGLLINSFVRLAGYDLNFDPNGLLPLGCRFPPKFSRKGMGPYRGLPYVEIAPPPALTLERIYNRLRVLPGVESVAAASVPPVNSLIAPSTGFTIEGQVAPVNQKEIDRLRVTYFLVTPSFFATMKGRLVRGRDFNDGDTLPRAWGVLIKKS